MKKKKPKKLLVDVAMDKALAFLVEPMQVLLF